MGDELIPATKIAVFRNKEIRKTFREKEWWFSVVDVIGALTESMNPRDYWFKMKARVKDEEALELSTICRQLKLEAADGKKYETDCANTEGMFRIIQSIPSHKAGPFKLWLARVGYERVQEIDDPELATKRTRALYKAKGYPDEWIEKRLRGIAIREELTDEWQKHGVEKHKEYEILTAEISKAAFGLTPNKHKRLKGLKQENLRDHMTDLELIFSMLGEASTTQITKTEHPKGFGENRIVARRGGNVAGIARKKLEQETKQKVISRNNYLSIVKKKKLKE